MRDFISKLEKDVFFWTKDIIFANFVSGEKKVLVGAFHLNSKA